MEDREVYIQSDWHKTVAENGKDTEFFIGFSDRGGTNHAIQVPMKDWKKGFQTDSLMLSEINARTLKARYAPWELELFIHAPQFECDELHSGPVSTIDINASGAFGLSADSYGGLLVWNTANMNVQRKLEGHALDVEVARFFPSGMVVLSGGMDMTVRVWSVADGSNVRTLTGHTRTVKDLAFVERGANVVSCAADGCVMKWDVSNSTPITSMSLGERARELMCIKWLTENKVMMVGASCAVLYAVAIDAKDEIIRLRHSDEVWSVEVNDHHVYTGTKNGEITVWDARTWQKLTSLKTNRGTVHRLKIVGSNLLAAFGNGSVIMYEVGVDGLRQIRLFCGADLQPVYDFAIGQQNDLYTAGKDYVIRNYRIPTQ